MAEQSSWQSSWQSAWQSIQSSAQSWQLAKLLCVVHGSAGEGVQHSCTAVLSKGQQGIHDCLCTPEAESHTKLTRHRMWTQVVDAGACSSVAHMYACAAGFILPDNVNQTLYIGGAELGCPSQVVRKIVFAGRLGEQPGHMHVWQGHVLYVCVAGTLQGCCRTLGEPGGFCIRGRFCIPVGMEQCSAISVMNKYTCSSLMAST